jgi:hypothetical protein
VEPFFFYIPKTWYNAIMHDKLELDRILKEKRFGLDDFHETKSAIYKAAGKTPFQGFGTTLCQNLMSASESFYATTGVYGDVVIATQSYVDKFKAEVGEAFEEEDKKAGKLKIVGQKARFIFLTSEHWKYDEPVLTYVGRRLTKTYLDGFINPVENKFYMLI